MIPYYTISKRAGHGDKKCKIKYYNFRPFYFIIVSEFEICQNEAIEWIEQIGHTRFNPFRDLQAGGTSFGFKGKNYWVSDNCWLGWFLKKIFKE